MPIFEYACKACEHQFETLVRGQETPECPACHSTVLDRQLSTFAPRTAGSSSPSSDVPMQGCGRCGDPRGPGACSMN